MPAVSRILFWQNIISPLQVPFIREVAVHFGGDVLLLVPEQMTKARAALGWSPPECFPAQLMVGLTKDKMREAVCTNPGITYHLFSGIRAYPFVWRAFRESLTVNTNRALISEPCRWHGIKGVVRLVRGRYERYRYGRYIDRIFAVGSHAEKWFRLCGYPAKRIVPFGYFTDTPRGSSDFHHYSAPFTLIFIGQCIRRKGVDILIRSLHRLQKHPWRLLILGDGRNKTYFEKMAQSRGLDKRITWCGATEHSEAMNILANADLLVLPSRWDGWGAVVNESLMRGVPVVCSNNCGAADLIRNSNRGSVFQSGSVHDCAAALEQWIAGGKPDAAMRKRIRHWSKNIAGDFVAHYFLEKIIHPHNSLESVPPWTR
jgi:glycosyltransferase involved in cell wall biosynthesis